MEIFSLILLGNKILKVKKDMADDLIKCLLFYGTQEKINPKQVLNLGDKQNEIIY